MLSLNHANEHPWVILVEDDESLRGQLASALERALPEVQVQRTPDADVALELARDRRSRVLITEAQTSSVDGLALAACARRQRPQLPLIFLGDARAPGAAARTAGLRGSYFVDKPLRLDHFVDLVTRVLEPPPGFRGELATNGVLELVQLIAMTMPTGALRLSGPAGAGSVWFENGSVVHAVFAHDRGSAAFQRMLRWRNGEFSMETGARAPERSVAGSTMELLLDAARRFDEELESHPGGAEHDPEASFAHERAPEPDADTPRVRLESHVAIRAVRTADAWSEPRPDEERRAAAHFESGLQAAWRKDYAQALPEWERAATLDPDNRLYQHNLERLRHLIKKLSPGQQLGGGDG